MAANIHTLFDRKGSGNVDADLSVVDAIFIQLKNHPRVQKMPLEDPRQSGSRSITLTGTLPSGEPEVFTHYIVFWSDGFTLDDGPVRRFDDPESKSFLESIKKYERPIELEHADRISSTVDIHLLRKNANYIGEGRAVGSSSKSTEIPTTPIPSSVVVVDETLPSTSIKLVLADRTEIIAPFNFHHTVNDIRAVIDAARPGSATNYQLQLKYPPKLLTDRTQTIELAGLANSVVIQK